MDRNIFGALDITIQLALPTPWGGGLYAALTEDQAARYKVDPGAVVAEALGCNLSDYLLWLDLDGIPQCCAQTQAGRQCRGKVWTHRFNHPNGFSAFEGYCAAHGG